MTGYLARRLLQAILAAIGVLVITFFLIRLVPGDPVRAQLGPEATPGAIAYWRNFYGLNDSLPQQFGIFVHQLLSLNLGTSIETRTPVTQVISAAIRPSLVLIAYSAIVSFLIAVPLALGSALRANKWQDQAVRVSAMITYGMPSFWIALLLVLGFSVRIRLFPTAGIGSGIFGLLQSLTLPAITIALSLAPVLIRNLRSSIVDTLASDYVEAARARGLSATRIMMRYVLRTSLLSTITILGINLGILVGGTVIVENVFAIPGIGSRTVAAVATRDFPVIQMCVFVIGLFVIMANLAADVLNVVLDPRIRSTQ